MSEGDTNTAYFHLIARGRKRRNFTPSLTADGHVITEHENMEMALHSHFTGVFGTPAATHAAINYLALDIQPIDLADLDNTFTPNEVWAAIKDMPSDRAPGPDGFTGVFYKTAWPLIREDIMAALHAFAHADSRNMAKLNNAIVVLLPKKVGAKCPADFRPITIVHSFAKLVSKILALRLAPKLNEQHLHQRLHHT